MDFFEQLKRTDLPAVQIPGIQRTRSFTDRVLNQYLRLFAHRLKPIKPLAMINGDMPVYDLTQPPLYSQAGARLLRTGFEHQVLKREPRPITMVIMLTKACDMHCRHCSAREYMRPGVESMDYEEICDLLDQFIELGGTSVVISGGEPTLHPRLMDVVARVPIDKAVVAMFTNGSRLDATMAAELRSAGLYAALVSLDSSVPEEHDDRRQRKGAYAQALRAVDAVLESGMLGGISTYMSRPDLERGGFDAMMRVAEDTGVHQIFIFDTVPTGALLKERELLLTPAHRAQLRDLVKEYNATPSGPAIMGQSWVNSSEGVGCFAASTRCTSPRRVISPPVTSRPSRLAMYARSAWRPSGVACAPARTGGCATRSAACRTPASGAPPSICCQTAPISRCPTRVSWNCARRRASPARRIVASSLLHVGLTFA